MHFAKRAPHLVGDCLATAAPVLAQRVSTLNSVRGPTQQFKAL